MNNAELISRLRDVPCRDIGTEIEETMLDAADLIEEQQVDLRKANEIIAEGIKVSRKSRAALEIAEKRIAELEAQLPKEGEWIDMGDFEMCSVCKIAQQKKYRQYYGGFMWVRTDFCPHCGSRMRKGEQE